MTDLSPEAKILLKKVRDAILEEPQRIHMDHWRVKGRAASHKGIRMPSCGTVGCIAGWVVELSGEKIGNLDSIEEAAKRILDIEESDALFFVPEWPEEFRRVISRDYYSEEPKATPAAPQSREYAVVVAARIDRFIESGGSE